MKHVPLTVASGAVASVVLLRVAAAQAAGQEEPTTTAPSAGAFTEPAPPPAAPPGPFPRVGGHLGFALPIVTISTETTVIGSDFVVIGLTPGMTVKLSEHWAVDFEFIARNEFKATPARTTWVVDPGVVYPGASVAGGLRVATEVGAPTNVGLVPIVVLPIVKISDSVSYYVEGDLPMFLKDGGTKMVASIGFQFQSGFSF